jgi:hypothetical protein
MSKKEVKKHNTLTDGFIPRTGKAVLPDKLVNALYWKYEQEGVEFTMTVPELRDLLGLKSTKDDKRMFEAIKLLQTPIQIRNFEYEGRGVKWMSAPFISRSIMWYDGQNNFHFKIDDMIIEGMKQKGGYTPLELDICNQFKSKYGLKLYEMFIRYYHLPNREGNGVGTISKEINDLNTVFGTEYTQPSQMMRGVKRGLEEIGKITGEIVTCFYNKPLKTFIFSWQQLERYPKLRIPFKRIDELIDWYLQHNQESLKIKSLPRYKQSLKTKIIEDQFEELDSLWSGMLKYKYGKEVGIKDGKYQDFKRTPQQGLI